MQASNGSASISHLVTPPSSVRRQDGSSEPPSLPSLRFSGVSVSPLHRTFAAPPANGEVDTKDYVVPASPSKTSATSPPRSRLPVPAYSRDPGRSVHRYQPDRSVVPPPLRLHPAFAKQKQAGDQLETLTPSTLHATGDTDIKYSALSSAPSPAELEELGRGAGFHSPSSISSLHTGVLHEHPSGSPQSRTNSLASSTTLPQSERDKCIHLSLDCRGLTPSPKQLPPRTPDASGRYLRVQSSPQVPSPQMGVAPPIPSAAQLKALPETNPSYDLAYYLKHTGPATKTDAFEEKKDKGRLGKFATLSFLRKSTSPRILTEPKDDPFVVPPSVVQKTANNGQKYYMISPRKNDCFTTSAAENDNSGLDSTNHKRRPSVTFHEQSQTVGTDALDTWIAALKLQASAEQSPQKTISRTDTRSTFNKSASSTFTLDSAQDLTELTDLSSMGTPDRKTLEESRDSIRWSALTDSRNTYISEKVYMPAGLKVSELKPSGSAATGFKEALSSNPPDVMSVSPVQDIKGKPKVGETSAATGIANHTSKLDRPIKELIQPSSPEGISASDFASSKDQGPTTSPISTIYKKNLLGGAKGAKLDKSEKDTANSPKSSDFISHEANCDTIAICGDPRTTENGRDSQTMTRKKRDFDRRHQLSIDGVLDAPSTPGLHGSEKEVKEMEQQSLHRSSSSSSLQMDPESVMLIAERASVRSIKNTKSVRIMDGFPVLSTRKQAVAHPEPVYPTPFETSCTPKVKETIVGSNSAGLTISSGPLRDAKHGSEPLPSTAAATAVLAELESKSTGSLVSSEEDKESFALSPRSRLSTNPSPSPMTPRELYLEERIEILEREKTLLETALLAVLRTGGRLNKCPCQSGNLEDEAQGQSALEIYAKTKIQEGEDKPLKSD